MVLRDFETPDSLYQQPISMKGNNKKWTVNNEINNNDPNIKILKEILILVIEGITIIKFITNLGKKTQQ